MLVGNKVDLEESSEREVSTETGETFAKVYTLIANVMNRDITVSISAVFTDLWC